MRTFLRTVLFIAAAGPLLASTTAQEPATKTDKKAPPSKEMAGLDALDWRQFPVLKGKVYSAAGSFGTKLRPMVDASVTLNVQNRSKVELEITGATLGYQMPFTVQEVFWDPKFDVFRGMRLVCDYESWDGVKHRYTIDVASLYQPGLPNTSRTMRAIIVHERDGQFRSVGAFDFEFEGELPKRR